MLNTSTLSLDEFVNQIQNAYSAEDYGAALRLMESNWPSVWFGFPPEELRSILKSIVRSGMDEHGFAAVLLSFLSSEAAQGAEGEQPSAKAISLNPAMGEMSQIGEVLRLRLCGQVTEANDFLERSAAPQSARNPLVDTSAGWNLFLSVQSGITAMLAGELKRALTHFAAAQFHVIVPALSFLNRDAYVKYALVHAAFGDVVEARNSLVHAARIPRTVSWAEPLIDAHVELVKVFLEQEGTKAARLLSSIALRDVGELWPFYLIALHQVLDLAGRPHELADRISVLEQVPFPKIEGDGFSGSVFALIRATIHMNSGDLIAARNFLALADQSFVGTRSIAAGVELRAGEPQQAIEVIGEDEPWTGLRRVELWRYAALAQGYLNLGNEGKALGALKTLIDIVGGIHGEDLFHFSLSVREFAGERLEEWPKEPAHVAPPHAPSGAVQTPRLTERERQILLMLSEGTGRKEMAQKLYVSINTLKSHLSAIYRKLGVSNRGDAILKADQEDLF